MEIKVPITHLSQGLDAIFQTVSTEHYGGKPLVLLSPKQKQEAVRLMHELGAFELRGAASDIGKKLGMSRVWVYKCLNT